MDPFVYQYSIGGLVFAVGLVYAWRQGYVGFSGRACRNLVVMLGGLLFFMAIQGYLQYAPMFEAEAVPCIGEAREAGKAIGKPVDYVIVVGYLILILLIGTLSGRRQKGTRDFFFGGQRFSWWLIAFSLVATLVGSYSFVKYSQAAYNYGFASSQSYLNDWALMPLLLFGWLPILYFSRITTVPEYFERRFNRGVRLAATVGVLVYLVSYVGVNLYTMGTVFHHLLGWDLLGAAALVAGVSAVYVTFGGQTSVIMTDLFQGVMLLLTACYCSRLASTTSAVSGTFSRTCPGDIGWPSTISMTTPPSRRWASSGRTPWPIPLSSIFSTRGFSCATWPPGRAVRRARRPSSCR